MPLAIRRQIRVDWIFHDAVLIEAGVKKRRIFGIMLQHIGIDHLFRPAIRRAFVILVTRLRVPVNGRDRLLMFVDEADGMSNSCKTTRRSCVLSKGAANPRQRVG